MSRIHNCRRSSGISLAAMAASLLIAPQCALAQSFNGTPTLVSGDVTFDTSPIPFITNVTVNSPRAVINWNVPAPSGPGAVIFQPQDTTANFLSGPGVNYIVLNRILPTDLTRAVQFNGTVNASGNNGVFFYSPGGIVLGNTAVFNVGRLLLTANDVAVDGNGGFFFANDLNLTAAAGSTSAVSIAAGAQINALAEGSFVLAVAPRVLDSGTTVVNGTKALVAAEAVDLTYNAGLFDISVTQGTEYVGDALRHEGSTTGPASSGTGDFHRVYMVAVPKNTAISMFISGAAGLGFDVAGAADVIGNAIVLSGGSNITEASNGTGIPQPFAPFPVNTIAADIDLTQGNYTSAVNILSNNDARISTIIPGNINFASDLTMQAENNAILNITNGAVTVNGQMFISADAAAPFADGSNQTAGTATVQISGVTSSLTTNSFATVTAQGFGANQISVGDGGTGSGGTASVNITGGSWISNSGLRVQAGGFGGNGNIGGNGIGGVANVTANTGSLQSFNGLELRADGTGGVGPQQGGAGTGGNANVTALGLEGIVDVSTADGFFVTADGLGGFGSNTSVGIGGTATGGSVSVAASNGGQVRTAVLVNEIHAGANGGAGAGGAGGNADAGSALISADIGGQVRFTGTASTTMVSASAISGSGTAGGSTSGGDVTITNLTGSTLLLESSDIQIRAYADGGAGAASDGGSAAGGNVAANLFGTSTFSGATNFDAHGNGGTSVNATGGAGTGGATRISSGGTTVFSSTLNANSNGAGGNGTGGGLGTGGQIDGTRVFVQGGTMTAGGAVLIDSSGFGGTGLGFGNGGGAVGGNSLVAVTSGAGTFNNTLNLNAIGTGGEGRNGGDGTGGAANVNLIGAANVALNGGALTITGASGLTSTGTGGNATAGLGGTGGDGTGGTGGLNVNSPAENVTLNAANFSAVARGAGGNGGSASAVMAALGLPVVGGNGGNGFGGNIFVGSPNSAGNMNLGAVGAGAGGGGGIGGAGGTFGPGGNGGNGTGGITRVGFDNNAPATATGTMNAASVISSTSSAGGAGGAGTVSGNGGNGLGGLSTMGNAAGGVVAVTGQALVASNGFGGFGAVQGIGEGGNAILASSPNPNGGASSVSAGSASVQASGLRLVPAPAVPGGFAPQPTGRYGRAAIVADGGNVQLGATTILVNGLAGPTTVAPAFGIINSGLLARNANLQINGSFNGQFAGNAALVTDGGNINFTGAGTSGFNFSTPGNIVDTLTGAAPTGEGLVTSNTFMNINAGGNILTPGALYQSALAANIVAGGNMNIRGASAGGFLYLQSGGSMTVGDILGGDVLEAVSGGAMTFGNIRADSDVDLTAAGAVTTGTISSGDTVTIGSGATISTGNIDAGINNPSADPAAAYAVGLRGVGTVTTGSITALNRIGVGSETGSVSTGAISTGEFFLALAETGVTVSGGITTGSGANGITYIADASMLALIDPVTLDPAPVFAAAPVRLNGNISISGPVSTGRFAAANTGTFTAGGAITVANGDPVTSSALFLSSGGAVTTQNLTTTAGGININSDAAITTAALNAETNVNFVGAGAVNSGDIISRGQVRVQTTGVITAGSIQANDNVGLFTDAAVTAGNILSNADVEIGTGANISTGSIEAENSVKLVSVNGAISTADIRSSQYFIALAHTGVNIGGGIATGTGANGVTYIADSSMANLIDPVTLSPAPLFNAAPVRMTGNVLIDGPVTTGRFVSGNTGTFTANGAITADASVLISSGGLASFGRIVGAPDITVTSGGLDIGVDGGLGTASTVTLNINAEPGVSAIRLGGDAGTGYVIDANEMARLRAQNIRFRTIGTAIPTITVSNFSLQGSAASESNLVGGSGAFAIETAGSVRVTGTAAINNAAAGNAFSITAGERIDIVNDQGGAIRLGNPAGDPAGILNLRAGTVTSASDSLIGQLTIDPNFAGRNAALDAAAASPSAQGYLAAGTMNISVSSGLFIQNSNTVQTPGGFSVGAGGFNVIIPASANGPVNLIVNGRALQASGTFLTGKDTLGAASFTPLTSFAEGATLNGCLITGAPCGVVTPENDLGFIPTQQADAIENNDEDEELELTGEALPIVLIEKLVTDPADEAPPRITEPVTGSGNSEAWSQTPANAGEQP
jgi:hypothetical protein